MLAIRNSLIPGAERAHTRPTKASSHNPNGPRGKFKVPTELRLVPEELCPREHVRLAKIKALEVPIFTADELPADLAAAIQFSVDKGAKIAGWRKGQQRVLSEAAKALQQADQDIKDAAKAPLSARSVAGKVHIALLAAIVEALN